MTINKSKAKKLLSKLSDIDSGVSDVYKSLDDELKDVAEKLKKSVEIKTINEANEQFKNLQKLFKPLLPKFEELQKSLTEQDKKLISLLKEKFAEVETMCADMMASYEKRMDATDEGLENLSNRLGEVEDRKLPDYTPTFIEIDKKIDDRTQELIRRMPDVQPLITDIASFREDLNKVKGRGGSANRQINVNSSVMSNSYTDINFVSNTAIRWTATNDNTNKRVNIVASLISGGAGGGGVETFAAQGETPLTGDVTISAGANITLTQTGQNIEIAASGGAASVTGISRTTSIISANTTGGTTTGTDYVYFATTGLRFTLPSAINNGNMYTVKNYSNSSVLVATSNGQTIDDSASALLPNPYESLSFISNSSIWGVV